MPDTARCWWRRPTNPTAASPSTVPPSPSSPMRNPTIWTITARRDRYHRPSSTTSATRGTRSSCAPTTKAAWRSCGPWTRDVAGRVVVYTTQDPDTLGDLNGAVAVPHRIGAGTRAHRPRMLTLRIPPALADGAELEVPVELSIPGIHNARNAAAAIIAAGMLGMPYERAARAAASFLGCGATLPGVRVRERGHRRGRLRPPSHRDRRAARRGPAPVSAIPHPCAVPAAPVLAHPDLRRAVRTGAVEGRRRDRGRYLPRPREAGRTSPTSRPRPSSRPRTRTVARMRGSGSAPSRICGRPPCASSTTVRTGDVVITVGAGDINRMDDVLLRELSARVGGMES